MKWRGIAIFWCLLALMVFQLFFLFVALESTFNGHIGIEMPDGVATDEEPIPEPTTAILWQLGDPPL
jgi:hypothetical protein